MWRLISVSHVDTISLYMYVTDHSMALHDYVICDRKKNFISNIKSHIRILGSDSFTRSLIGPENAKSSIFFNSK